MKILVFSSIIGTSTTNFIHNQVLDVSEKVELLYVCNEYVKNPLLEGKIKIKTIPFKDNKILAFFRKRLELHDIFLSFKNRLFANKFSKIVSEFKPDIIHAQFGYDAIMIYDNFKNINIPFIISFRGFDASMKLTLNTYKNRLREILIQPHVYATFVCKHLRENLRKHNINLNNEHLILYSNTDLDFFKPKKTDIKNTTFTFLQISSFREKKGHVYTIKAFHEFLKLNENCNAKLILTGEGGAIYEACKRLVSDLGIIEKVEFIGWIDRQKARDLLSQSHVGVLHSVTDQFGDQEGIPNALMEAMAMNLPVISTFHAGIPELVAHEKNGYLVEEKDIQSYAKYMFKLYHNWELKAENRQKVIQGFERKKHTNTLIEYYKKCINL